MMHYSIGWSEIHKKIDMDGDGRIDFHEFLAAIFDQKDLFNDDYHNLERIFKYLDTDTKPGRKSSEGDGILDINDLMRNMPTNLNINGEVRDMGHTAGALFKGYREYDDDPR